MRDPDSHDLDVLLRSAATDLRAPEDEARIFSDVWSRVQAFMDADSATTSSDAV